MELMQHQIDAKNLLASGKILWGGVGTGKTATALAYYNDNERPRDIYVITTAKKRDSLDWEKEAAQFSISTDVFLENDEYTKHYGILTVDSWNQIGNYEGITDAFFIFDEQRLVGTGSWVKSFQKIAKTNHWIMLSATPGDNWLDYAPVFIANGHYKHITDFKFKHVLYEPYHKYPKVRGYLGEKKLEKLRNDILVEMPFLKHTKRMINYMDVAHDQEKCDIVKEKRWNPFDDVPVKDAGDMFRLTKRIVYSDPSRLNTIRFLLEWHNRLIIFYNYNFELEILRTLHDQVKVYEWNGHKKDNNKTFEDEEKWVYLVQYVSGAEAWNCTKTEAMVLYSLTYSYKNFEQSMGRIDRLDTPSPILYYYVLVSNIWLDRAVKKALGEKKSFNEREYLADEDELPCLK